MRKSRPVDARKQVERLEHEHRALKHEVATIDGMTFLTAAEQIRRLQLKKRKLAAKDALESLRQSAP